MHYYELCIQISITQENAEQNLFKIGPTFIVISIWITYPNQVFHR